MNKFCWFIAATFFTVLSYGQNKEITLNDAVLQQYRAFRADQMLAFQWIPNSSNYAYLEDSGRKLMTASTSNTKAQELISLTDLNSSLGTKLRSFFGIEFVDKNTFIIQDGIQIFQFDLISKTGKKIFTLDETAENQTFNHAKSNLAFTIENNLFYYNSTGEKVAITNESNKNIVSGQAFARSEFGIRNGIFWSPKSNFIAFYQKDESNVADYPLVDITETPGKLNNIKYPMAGQASEKPKVGIYNMALKRTVYISPKGNSDDYLTNLSWTPDELFVLIAEVNRAQNEMNLNVYNSLTGTFVKTLFTEKATTWVEPEHAAFFPNSNSKNFVWVSEKDGFNNLYYYSFDGKLIKKLTQNKFPVDAILGSNQKGTEVYFSATGVNGTNMLGYKVDLNGNQKLITSREGVHNLIPNFDGSHFFDEFSTSSIPSKSLLIDKGGKSVTLLESNDKYVGYVKGTSEIKTIKSADGTTDLYTRLIKPSNFDPQKKYPVFVYVYGGPHAQMITNSYLEGANLWMYWMAEQGYLVFTVDNRGSANRGKAFEDVIHRNLGKHEMEDQIKGVEYLKSLPYVDADRLAVHGWSYGGFMTTSLMLKYPDTFKVGVAGGPVTDWKYYEIMYGERYMDTPQENPTGYSETSTLNFVKDLKGKLLLIHGTSDDVVVMQHNFSLIKKFIEAEKQVDFFPYPMHKHNVSGKDRVHLIQKVLDYVIENNK